MADSGSHESRFGLDGETALQIVELSPGLISVIDDEGRYLYVSPSLGAAFGVPAAELVGTHFNDRLHPVDQARAAEAVAGRAPVTDVRLRHADGHWLLAEGDVLPLPPRDGSPPRVVAFSRIISEQRRLERLHRAVVETAQEGILVSDEDGITVLANDSLLRMLGYAADELIDRPTTVLVRDDDEASSIDRLERRKRGEMERYELILVRRDGSTFPAFISTMPQLMEDGTYGGSVTLITDLTERLELQAQLVQSQKMEGIGQLAGGVAHDLNNVLAIMGLNLDLIERVGMSEASASRLRQAVENGRALTRQLLAFAKRQPQAPEAVSPNSIVESLAELARPLLGSQIELELRLDPEAGHVFADRSQLDQVLMNLLVNARDAMTGGGRITIETGDRVLDESYAPYEPNLKAGTYVMIGVQDDGAGMDDDTRRRIFEPFFSTKGDQGTGLGLSTSYGIVQQTGGFVWVYSRPGQGTSFKVYLPRVEPADEPRPAPPGSGQRILVVDDQPEIGLLAAGLLNGSGYSAVFAADQAGALELAREERFDAVVCDVFVGADHGPDIVDELRRDDPAIPVLFVSGHTSEVLRGDADLLDGHTDFIGKPYGADLLLTRLAALLAAEG